MSNKILVIGAAGTVCLEIVKFLSSKGEDIRVGCRNPDKAKALNFPGVEMSLFDYLHPESFESTFIGVNRWVLVSPPPHLNLIASVKKAIEQAVEAGVKHVINISTMGVENDEHPIRKIENHIESSGMEFAILRPNCYMQYFNTYFRDSIVEADKIRIPAGDSKTSFVDVRDVAAGAASLLLKDTLGDRTYTLTGGKALSLYNVAHIMTEELGREITYDPITDEEYREMLQLSGWTNTSIDASLSLCKYVRQGWNAAVTSDLLMLLQKEPITFGRYVRDHVEYWKQPSEDFAQ